MADDGEAPATNPLVAAAEAAFDRAHAKHVDRATEAKDAFLTKWLEDFEAEHAGVMQQILPAVLAHPAIPDHVRTMLAEIVNPAHQTQALLGMAAVYAIISSLVSAAIGPEVQEVSNVAFSLNPNVELTPNELAVAVNKGWLEQGAAEADASRSGVSPANFDRLVKLSGNPPGTDALMEALRRGVIDGGRFEHGVRESNIRPEWLDVLLALRYSPVGVGTVVQAAVQGHLSRDDMSERIKIAGVDPDNADWLFETAGRPPGIHELAELLNRGEISEAVLKQAIRESDIKNKYVDEIVKLRRKIPPMRTIVAAIHQGALSESEGVHKLQQLGYNAEDAAMLAHEGTAMKHAVDKALTKAEVKSLYTARMITRAQAATMIGQLGYDATETEFLLSLADHDRHQRAMTTAINRVHSRYVAYRLDRTDAIHALGAIGVDPQGRDDLLGTWDDERDANAPVLTLAQLDGMVRRKLISQTVFRDHVLRLGYDIDVIPKLYALAFPATADVPKWEP